MKYEKTWRFKSIIKQSLQIQRLIKFKWVLLKLILFHYWWKNIIKNETENYININNKHYINNNKNSNNVDDEINNKSSNSDYTQSNKNNNNNNSNIIIKNNYKNITVTTKILSISNDKKISIEMEVVFNIKYTEIWKQTYFCIIGYM